MMKPTAFMLVLAACGAQDLAPPDAATSIEKLEMPNVTLAAGQEATMCVTLQLSNDTPKLLRRAHSVIAPGSHHLIAYRVADGAVNATPTPCVPFADVANGVSPLMIAESPDAEVRYPDDVGLPIAAHQLVRLEEHFLNSGDQPLDSTGSVELELADDTAGMARADLLFWGPQQFTVAPHAAGSAEFFHLVDPNTYVFAVTTHEHHFGTLATVERASGPSPTAGVELYRNTDWAHPQLAAFDPPVQFGGADGLRLHCEWMNTSDAPVSFGLSAATSEMCFFWAYYYPSHGFELCNEMGCVTR